MRQKLMSVVCCVFLASSAFAVKMTFNDEPFKLTERVSKSFILQPEHEVLQIVWSKNTMHVQGLRLSDFPQDVLNNFARVYEEKTKSLTGGNTGKATFSFKDYCHKGVFSTGVSDITPAYK